MTAETAKWRALSLLALGSVVGICLGTLSALGGYESVPQWFPKDAIAVVNGKMIPAGEYRRAVAMLASDKRNALTGAGFPALSSLGLGLFVACYLALATSRERAARLRPSLTLVFGLIHGFGFASVLLDSGLPTERLVWALLGFNLGVELGQVALVALAWGAGQLLVRHFVTVDYRLAADAASAGLCGLGLFWFVERALSRVGPLP